MQYEEIGEEVVGKLDGMFSFVLVDLRDKSFIAARDPLGITPLYLGWGNDGLFRLPLIYLFVFIFRILASRLSNGSKCRKIWCPMIMRRPKNGPKNESIIVTWL